MAKTLKEFTTTEKIITVVLFICAIIPGILYLIYKTQWQK